ncbi:C39 family peptidase [Bacillus sp. REN3]|uniref:C39 family peptidase n=1 Tax=Bacillus sp. REN3 TaxID=2802440 RepID=UPI001AEE6ACB|nr:C39 family peptidase [Bacillus sp. REN3]
MKAWHFIGILLPLLGCSHGTPADNAAQTQQADTKPTARIHQSAQHTDKKDAVKPIGKKILLDVPLIRQNPELKYGCEVTSLAMVLNYAGATTDKMKLYKEIKKDEDPLRRSPQGDILSWGDPTDGFVGDMTGKQPGYAVFDQPMIELIDQYLPGRAVNLTGKDFNEILVHVSKGFPVVIWTTGDYRLPDRPESWTHGKEVIKSPLDLHVVVLVGHEDNKVFVNDPLSGKKQVGVNKQQFIQTWKVMQSRAVSYR